MEFIKATRETLLHIMAAILRLYFSINNMIDRRWEIYKINFTKLHMHLLPLASKRSDQKSVCGVLVSIIVLTVFNLYASQLKNKHIRHCQLPVQCCQANMSINAVLST